MRLLFPVAAHVAHFSEGLLFGLVADGAGVDKDGIGLRFVAGDGVAAFTEHLRDLFGVALVHLATVGADVDLGHGGGRV